jgi:transposase
MPTLTVRMAWASNPGGTTAMWVRDHLDGLWGDEDFTCWYPRDGRPGLSPAQLATVCVLQFVLTLSDRQAAEAVRCRIDFKYALGLELDDPGFHHSVLSDFRDRLAEGDRADRLLDLALDRMRSAGLLNDRGRQRTDSTHVLAAVRDLTRLELVTEAIRAALEELARDAPHLLDGLIDEEWAKRYGRPVRLVSQPSRPATRLKQAGGDAYVLLQHLHSQDRARARGRQAEALRRVYATRAQTGTAAPAPANAAPSPSCPATCAKAARPDRPSSRSPTESLTAAVVASIAPTPVPGGSGCGQSWGSSFLRDVTVEISRKCVGPPSVRAAPPWSG